MKHGPEISQNRGVADSSAGMRFVCSASGAVSQIKRWLLLFSAVLWFFPGATLWAQGTRKAVTNWTTVIHRGEIHQVPRLSLLVSDNKNTKEEKRSLVRVHLLTLNEKAAILYLKRVLISTAKHPQARIRRYIYSEIEKFPAKRLPPRRLYAKQYKRIVDVISRGAIQETDTVAKKALDYLYKKFSAPVKK